MLHALVDELELARPRRGIRKLGPRGRKLCADPAALLATIASTTFEAPATWAPA